MRESHRGCGHATNLPTKQAVYMYAEQLDIISAGPLDRGRVELDNVSDET